MAQISPSELRHPPGGATPRRRGRPSRHTVSLAPSPRIQNRNDLKSRRELKLAGYGVTETQIDRYLSEVGALANAFNAHSRDLGLGLHIDATVLFARVKAGDLTAVAAYCDDSERGGRIYENQIETLTRLHLSLLKDPVSVHILLGALQSGKTGTAILIIVHALAFYAMTGIALSPLYLLPNFLAQEAQMAAEMERFLLFYGHLEFHFDRNAFTAIPLSAGDEWDALGQPPSLTLTPPRLDPSFAATPNLRTFLAAVLGVESARDLIVRRSQSEGDLDAQIARMAENALVPLPVLDEVQYGASGTESRSCLTHRIMTRILAERIEGRAPRYVCVSATPFAEMGTETRPVIRQRLPQNYSGITHFLGELFPGYETAQPLSIQSLTEAETAIGIDGFARINLRIYADAVAGRLSAGRFETWCKGNRHPYRKATSGKIAKDYIAFVEWTLRQALVTMALRNGGRAWTGRPRGLCIRLGNSNRAADAMLKALDLEASRIDVVRFYGDLEGQSLKEVLAHRAHPNWPYVIVATARARMADAFPKDVETYIDFVEQTTDYNSLLQGFVGRAMGAGKASTVILTDENAEVIRDYISTKGKSLRIPATKHGHNVGDTTPNRRTQVLRVCYGKHETLDAFLDEIQQTVIDRAVSPGKSGRRFPRFKTKQINQVYERDVKHRIRLLGIVREFGLDTLIAQNPNLVMSGFSGEARIANHTDHVLHRDGQHYAYSIDPENADFVTVGLRETGPIGGRGWREDVMRKGRAPSANDIATDAVRSQNHLEPTIGLTMDEEGRYRIAYIDLPLAESARVAGRGADRVIAKKGHFANDSLSPCDRILQDFHRPPTRVRKHEVRTPR